MATAGPGEKTKVSPSATCPVESVSARAYEVPTDRPEGDGTLSWDSTVAVVVHVRAGGCTGLGWSYSGRGALAVVSDQLAPVVTGRDAFDVPGAQEAMVRAVRNLGRPGLAGCAVSAVDIALWDLKARLLGVALSRLFGASRAGVPIYGSGGFTTYSDEVTTDQLREWTCEWRVPRVKIKIGESWGTRAARDMHRIGLARRTVGPDVELYVDANGGYTRKQAVRLGRAMREEADVSWFEEPVSSDDLEGLREVRGLCDVDIAAGEYGYDLAYFARMLEAGAVDCLQADVTRCGGYTTWLRVAALAAGRNLEVSGHCAPNAHAHAALAVPNLRHLEYFHDHHRIEQMLFSGALSPEGGELEPDPGTVGNGLELKEPDAERYRVG